VERLWVFRLMLVEPSVSLTSGPVVEADERPYLGIIRTYDTRCYSLCDRMLHLPIQVRRGIGGLELNNLNHTEYYSIHTLSWLALIVLFHPTIPDSTGLMFCL
jgi:hypothetical protein